MSTFLFPSDLSLFALCLKSYICILKIRTTLIQNMNSFTCYFTFKWANVKCVGTLFNFQERHSSSVKVWKNENFRFNLSEMMLNPDSNYTVASVQEFKSRAVHGVYFHSVTMISISAFPLLNLCSSLWRWLSSAELSDLMNVRTGGKEQLRNWQNNKQNNKWKDACMN